MSWRTLGEANLPGQNHSGVGRVRGEAMVLTRKTWAKAARTGIFVQGHCFCQDSIYQDSGVSHVVLKMARFAFPVGLALPMVGLAGQAAMAEQASLPVREPVQSAQALPEQTSQYNFLFVDSNRGDNQAPGTERSPLKTITQALQIASPNTIIMLAPGTYSEATGEVFPLQLKPGTTIKGKPHDRGQNTVIKGGGFFLSRTFARQNVTLVGANQAGLTGVTVTNPNAQGYGLWVESSSPVIVENTFTGSNHDGVSIVGNSAPILRNNYFLQNGANGVTIYGTSRPELQENIFEKTGFGINVAQNAAPRIIGNRVTQNKDGIIVQGKAQPILRNNVVDGNERDGIVAIAQSRPNLGTSDDPGNNSFASNGQLDINARTNVQTLPAFGNQITARKTLGKLDFSGTATVADNPVTPPVNVASTVPFRQAVPQINSAPAESGSASLPLIAVSAENSKSGRSLPRPPQPNLQGGMKQILVPNLMIPTRSTPSKIVVNSAVRFPGSSSPTQSRAISIPVPAPESGVVAPVAMRSINPPISSESQSSIMNSELLPVPGPDVPIGNTGGAPSGWSSGIRQSPGTPMPLRSQTVALGLRYRVVVDASSPTEQSQLRAIVPNAFRIFAKGRSVMQAGAFRDRAEADELLQSLTNRGLRASIDSL